MSERTSSFKIFLVLLGALSIVGLDLSLSQTVLQLVYELPNSRKHELEGVFPPLRVEHWTYLTATGLADKVGLSLMARACYDPAAAPA